MCCSSPKTAPTWIPSMGYSPSGIDCSNVGSWQVTVTVRKSAVVWASLHRPQLLTGSCSSMGSPWAAASFRPHFPLLSKGIHALNQLFDSFLSMGKNWL